ncbi:predicted protein [Nematostella vectensis]|uniref:Uncharacterized protein n=1 Tax=Nematostella vectensis TaxID=45351 RepID=A7RWT9_NEMVE|nr:predicted protein [Nematostella vectensis]|eukprot:XP_001636095.1 predicted protein [Nematostella vectensis]
MDIDFDPTTEEGREDLNTTVDEDYDSLIPNDGEGRESWNERISNRFGRGASYFLKRRTALKLEDSKRKYNNMCGGVVRRKQNGRFSESDKELWSLLSICLAKQKAMKRKRTPDFYKVAVLEKSIRRLNDEIADRCLRKTKRRRKSAAYEWNSGGHGWNTTASFQDDEDLLE